MRKRTLKEKFYTGCGYSIFGALAFAFFLGLSVAYGIKTASIIVGARPMMRYKSSGVVKILNIN